MNAPFAKMELYNAYLKSAKDLLEKCSFHYEESKTLQKSIEENAEKYKACSEECISLKTSLDTAKTEIIALNKTCQDLRATLDVATKENDSLNAECKKLKVSLNAATEKANKLEKECTASELSYSEVVNENANLKISLNEVKNANTELSKRCNDLTSSLEDIKEKWKLSNQIVKTLKRERRVAKENLAKKMSEMLGTVFKPPTNSSALPSEVILSSDDSEDDSSKVVSSSQCDDKVNILSKPKSVDESGKKVQIGDHENQNQSVSSDKEVNRPPSPTVAAVGFKNNKEKNMNVLSKKSNFIIPPSATSSILSLPSKTRVLSVVAEVPSNRATGAVSPRKDSRDVERSSTISILTSENKPKPTFSSTKAGKQDSSPRCPSSASNSPNKCNRAITFSPTSPRRNNRSPIPSVSTLITTETQFKEKSASPNNKDDEKCNRSSPTPILSLLKVPNPTTQAASLKKDDIGHKGSLVSPMLTLNNQSNTKPTSPKDNESSTLSSPVSISSFNQNRPIKGILVTSPKKDDHDMHCSSTSAVPVSENQSKAKSVTLEEKGYGPSPSLVDNAQSNPTIITSVSLGSPVILDNQSDTCNKEQNKTCITDSQNDQNGTSFLLRAQGDVPTNSPPSSDKSSRASLLLTRAQDRGPQLDHSLKGHSKCADDTGLLPDSIMKSSTPNENKSPLHNKEPNPENLLSMHFSNLRKSPSKTLVCNEDSNSETLSVLESEEECSVLPSSSVHVESVPERPSSFPVVYIPRIDEVTDELRAALHSPRESRKNKRTSIVSVDGPSKRRRSSTRENVQISKNSQRVIKQKKLYEYSCSQCSFQFTCNSDLNQHIFQIHRGSKVVRCYKLPKSPHK